MEEARKKIRICLICIVVAAVAIGLIYYLLERYGQSSISEGTLVWLENGEE